MTNIVTMLLVTLALTACTSIQSTSTEDSSINRVLPSMHPKTIDCLTLNEAQTKIPESIGPRNISDVLYTLADNELYDEVADYSEVSKCSEGKLIVALTINFRGDVKKAEKISSSFTDTVMESMLLKVVTDINFGQINNIEDSIIYVPIEWRNTSY